MMKQISLIVFFFLTGISVMAQDSVIKVWPKGTPNDNGLREPERVLEGSRVENVSEAEMYVYLPEMEKNTGAAVLICPGGGYIREAIDHEGFKVAEFLKERGVAGIVLKYRLPYGHSDVPSSDARRALRTIRANAEKWGIDPSRIGIAGSSAGGHLASTAGTVFDTGNPENNDPVERLSCRPDFMLLLYPVVTMNEEFTHLGSRENLIGKGHDKDLIRKYSNELNVSPETPPTFLILADDDGAVPPRNSIEFYSALKRNNVPAEMHIFQQGGHGFGMNKSGLPAANWPELFMNWLKARKIVE